MSKANVYKVIKLLKSEKVLEDDKDQEEESNY